MSKLDNEKLLKQFKDNYRIFEYLLLRRLLLKEDISDDLNMEMKKMQNADGGFKGLMEPDIRSENSAIISTVEALELYRQIGEIDKEVKVNLEKYLKDKYDEEYLGWHIVSGDIYDDPRAVWWNKDIEDSFDYANPTAQIIGYADLLSLDLDVDVEKIYDKLIETNLDTDNMHTYTCMVELFRLKNQNIPAELIEAGEKLIEWDENKWNTYCLGPSDIVDNPNHPLFGKYKEKVLKHLEYKKTQLLSKGYIDTTWNWTQYEEFFAEAQQEWRGILTLAVIRKLKNFDLL